MVMVTVGNGVVVRLVVVVRKVSSHMSASRGPLPPQWPILSSSQSAAPRSTSWSEGW
jgi:hypothetical protein